MIRLFFLLALLPTFTFAQKNSQNIRGVVTDKLSQTPLIGALVQISSLQKGTITEIFGKFTLSNISPDRYDLKISYAGYNTITIPNVVVTSGKEVDLILHWKKPLKV